MANVRVGQWLGDWTTFQREDFYANDEEEVLSKMQLNVGQRVALESVLQKLLPNVIASYFGNGLEIQRLMSTLRKTPAERTELDRRVIDRMLNAMNQWVYVQFVDRLRALNLNITHDLLWNEQDESLMPMQKPHRERLVEFVAHFDGHQITDQCVNALITQLIEVGMLAKSFTTPFADEIERVA